LSARVKALRGSAYRRPGEDALNPLEPPPDEGDVASYRVLRGGQVLTPGVSEETAAKIRRAMNR